MEKLAYDAPNLTKVGTFETLTQGGSDGSRFDGNFVVGQPVPRGEDGLPLIFS